MLLLSFSWVKAAEAYQHAPSKAWWGMLISFSCFSQVNSIWFSHRSFSILMHKSSSFCFLQLLCFSWQFLSLFGASSSGSNGASFSISCPTISFSSFSFALASLSIPIINNYLRFYTVAFPETFELDIFKRSPEGCVEAPPECYFACI